MAIIQMYQSLKPASAGIGTLTDGITSMGTANDIWSDEPDPYNGGIRAIIKNTGKIFVEGFPWGATGDIGDRGYFITPYGSAGHSDGVYVKYVISGAGWGINGSKQGDGTTAWANDTYILLDGSGEPKVEFYSTTETERSVSFTLHFSYDGSTTEFTQAVGTWYYTGWYGW